jgi:hypothetical protein
MTLANCPGGFTTPRVGTPARDQPMPKHPRSGLRAHGIPRCQGTAQVPVHCGLAFTT